MSEPPTKPLSASPLIFEADVLPKNRARRQERNPTVSDALTGGEEEHMKKSKYSNEQITFARKPAETGTSVASVYHKITIS